MAITKIHPIKSTIQKSVDYITNPAKTDEQLLVSSYACSYQFAEMDFNTSLMHGMNRQNQNPAYHLIQSFAPGEIDKEEAHRIGVELADEILKGKHSYIISTHIDKNHVHNHIIFCSVDNVDYGAYHDCKSSYRNIRNTSDRLCKEHGLMTIDDSRRKGMNYLEWTKDKSGNSLKCILKFDISEAIRKAKDYEDFVRLMIEKGYSVKGQELDGDAAKYIAFKAKDYERYIRCSYKNLGKGYTKEEIVDRILKQVESRRLWAEKQEQIKLSERRLIDTSSEKFANNDGLKNWAEGVNLQIAASTFAEIGSITNLNQNIEECENLQKDTSTSIKEIDDELKRLGEIIKYMDQYERFRAYGDNYNVAKDKEAYMRQNEYQMLLYEGASDYLKRLGVNPGKEDIESYRNRYEELASKRKSLKQNQVSVRDKLRLYKQQADTINQYTGINRSRKQNRNI